jgi:hypothetical protein
VPNRLDQLVLAHDPVAVLNEVNEYVEHLRLDVDGRTGLPQLLSRGIDFEIAEAEIQSFPRPKGRISSTASQVLVCRGGVPVQRLLYHSQGISTKSSGKFRANPQPGCKFVAQFAPTPPPRAAAPAQILLTGGADNITINDISGTDRKRAFRER